MKKTITLLTLAMLFSFAQGANQTATDSSKTAFYSAFDALKNMLEGKDSLNYEKAIFITENAYYDNKFSFEYFSKTIDSHIKIIDLLAEDAKQQFQDKYKTMRKFEQKMFNLNATNWAIYKYITDTIIINDSSSTRYKLPFNYSNDDPYGSSKWENTQVLNLLNNNIEKGNCYALTSLFKIFSDHLKSEARLVTTPHHIYIQNRNTRGDFKNIELATKTFPGDGSIQTLTYTTKTTIMEGMAQQPLDDKQTIALNLIYLAKGFQHKFNDNTNDFLLQCADLVIKHDSLSMNALLLKAEITENKLFERLKENKISTVSQARTNPKTKTLLASYEKQLSNLYKHGYREIPKDIQHIILSAMQGNKDGYITTDKTPNPFAEFGEKTRYATLSWGLFDEMHYPVDTIQYFHAYLNTKKNKIIEFLPIDTSKHYKVDPVVFAMSVDPMTAATPGWSPYAAFNNNPILYVDPDGNFSISNHYKFTKTAVKQLGYNDVVADLVAHYASVFADHPAKWITYQQGQYYRTGIDYSKTASSQNTTSPEYSAWHAMKADNENITDAAAMERGLSFGWSKILEAGEQAKKIGGVGKLQKNSAGIQALGQGIHTLQDAIAHKGTDMQGHDLMNDMYPSSSDITKATQVAFNAVLVTEALSGNYSNIKEGMSIDLTGTTMEQYNKITSAFQSAVSASSTDKLTKVYFTGKPQEEK